jgi:hypothetical protein
MPEAEAQAEIPEPIEFIRVHVSDYGQMMFAGLQVLAEGEHVATVFDEVSHYSPYLADLFSKSEH